MEGVVTQREGILGLFLYVLSRCQGFIPSAAPQYSSFALDSIGEGGEGGVDNDI